MSEPEFLDSHFLAETSYNALDHLAGVWKRFLNMLIDVIIVYALAFLVGMGLALSGNAGLIRHDFGAQLIVWLIYLLYYIIMEVTTGLTIGKLATQTRVVTEDGSKPSIGQLIGRSFSRLIPFDAFSYLGGNRGWHDSISSTFVVNK
ncbi:MAG: RDD family protein [Bacteroidia bacterium]